ncbi:MAG: L-threonylcarbamoyladenylate synthase [Polyangiales bacterium]
MLTDAELRPLLAALRSGGVVACATETLFGLLADALDPQVVERVCALKGRDPDQPIAVLLPDYAALAQVCSDVPAAVPALAAAHWPGPLTLVVPARPGLPAALTRAGKIGVRVPGASPALDLVRAFGAPLTATSANLTGQPAATTLAEVLAAFPRGLAGTVAAPAPGGPASSVIDVTGPQPVVIRQGAVKLE